MSDFIDKFGLVTVKGGDGGDTHANVFTILYCDKNNGYFDHSVMPYLKGPNNIPIRHPDPDKWYHYEDRCSRDQMIPLLYYLASNRSSAIDKRFYELMKLHLKRGFLFTWNTKRNHVYPTLAEHLAKSTPDVKWDYKSKMPDITGPEVWAAWMRGLINRCPISPAMTYLLMFPALCLFDIEGLVGSVIKQYKWHFKRKNGTGRDGIDHDDRNHALGVHFANHNSPTPVSWLSKIIYGKERPLYCFKSFWSDQSWEPPIDQFMNKLY